MDEDRVSPETPAEPGAPPAHEPPPAGAGVMNALRWGLFAGLLLLAAASVGGYLMSRGSGGPGKTATKQAAYYCPMHPSYTSDRPGECPICGMTLEPIPKAGAHETHQASGDTADVPGLTAVHLTPERIQMIGVRTAVVARRATGAGLELVGFVTPDEALVRRVQLRAPGWVQQLQVARTGELVWKGQPLLSIYSPELYQSEREFLIELEAAGGATSEHAPAGGTLAAARQRLLLLGVDESEIGRLEREREPSSRLVLRSPVDGTVLERGAAEGQYVGAETPLFTVADLSRVWVLADLYEMDFTRVRAGERVAFAADALPGRSFEGAVDLVYPTVSSATRTLKARVALANPDRALRPGMYGRLHVAGGGARVLAVPAEAVVNAGRERYVFLASADGHFTPRRVAVGAQDGEWVQILSGVAEGDTVVASASFLIDSESRLKAAISGMAAPGHPH